MLRQLTQLPKWIALGCATAISISISLVALPVAAQDSQAVATAQAARDKIAAENTAKAPPSTGAAIKSDAETSAAASESLKRKAGERVGSAPRGRSLILGMHLQESSRGGVKVVEVATASPAFEAGIRKEDELVTFAGFRGTNYRNWIEGISRLATAAEDNSMLPVEVMRRGQHVDAQIRVPESHTTAVKLPLGPMPQPGQAAGPEDGPMPVAGSPPIGGGGGNDNSIENVGQFANFFGGDSAPISTRAMAEIVRVGAGKQGTEETGIEAPGAAPMTKGARIGLAGFRNELNGLLVMVDVGSLPPGNYTVGLSDPSVVGISADAAVAPGAEPPADATASTIPPTGQLNPTNTTPTGQSTVNNALVAQADHTNAASSGAGALGGPMFHQIGTLTVDQSGTGRMQHVVEAMRVRNVVGQAIVLSAVPGSDQTLPANLDPTIDPARGKTAADVVQSTDNTSATKGIPAAVATTAPVPVAAGIIRLMSDRRPPAANPATDEAVFGPPASPIQQPANIIPPVGTNPIR